MTNRAFDRWNERFGSDDYLFGTAPNGFLASQANLLRVVRDLRACL